MTNNTPLVSIIMPTKNRLEMLKRSVSSVISQTYTLWELIVVLDGCTDDSEEYLKSIDDKRIRVVSLKKSYGASGARNRGIKLTKGELIAFLDDDDEWFSTKLAKQISKFDLNNDKIGLIYCWMNYYDENKKLVYSHNPTVSGYVFDKMVTQQSIGGCPSIIIKKSIIDEIGLFDENLFRGNDGDYWRRITQKFHVQVVSECLVNVYVGHNDRISVNSVPNLKFALISFEKWLKVFHDDYNKYPKKKVFMLFRCFNYSLEANEFKKAILYLVRIKNINNHQLYKLKTLCYVLYKYFLRRGVI